MRRSMGKGMTGQRKLPGFSTSGLTPGVGQRRWSLRDLYGWSRAGVARDIMSSGNFPLTRLWLHCDLFAPIKGTHGSPWLHSHLTRVTMVNGKCTADKPLKSLIIFSLTEYVYIGMVTKSHGSAEAPFHMRPTCVANDLQRNLARRRGRASGIV